MNATAPSTRPTAASTEAPTAVLLIDGVCALCQGAVRFILDHERADAPPLRFAPLQSDAAKPLLARAGIAEDYLDGVVFVSPDGRALAGADAALHVARWLRQPWRGLAAVGRAMPRAVRDGVYGLVARSRYRIFGTKEVCGLPTEVERARMLGA